VEKYYTGISFITFETRAMAKEALSKYRERDTGLMRLKTYRLHHKNSANKLQDFELQKAAQPSNIFWHNMGIPTCKVYSARILSSLASTVIIAMSLLILVVLKNVQIKITPRQVTSDEFFSADFLKARAISIMMMFVVVIINSSLAYTLRILNGKECFTTTNAYMSGLTIKIAMAQFINSNLLIVLTHVLVQVPNGVQVYHNNGLLYDAWTIMIGEVVIPPLKVLLNPYIFLKIFTRLWMRFKIEFLSGVVTQQELNRAYEKPIFDPAKTYAQVFRTMGIVIFLQPLFPISGLLGFLCFFFLYWCTKLGLLRQSSRPISIASQLAYLSNFLISYILLIYGMSSAIFDKIFIGKLNSTCICIIAFGVLNAILPIYRITCGIAMIAYSWLGHSKNKFSVSLSLSSKTGLLGERELQLLYDDARPQFYLEYDRVNPITAPEATKEYFMYLQTKLSSEMLVSIADEVMIQSTQLNPQAVHYFGSQQNKALFGAPSVDLFKSDLSSDNAPVDNLVSRQLNRRDSIVLSPLEPTNQKKMTKVLNHKVLDWFTKDRYLQVDPLARAFLDLKANTPGFDMLLENGFSAALRGCKRQATVPGFRSSINLELDQVGSTLRTPRNRNHTVSISKSHYEQSYEGDIGSTNRDLQGRSTILNTEQLHELHSMLGKSFNRPSKSPATIKGHPKSHNILVDARPNPPRKEISVKLFAKDLMETSKSETNLLASKPNMEIKMHTTTTGLKRFNKVQMIPRRQNSITDQILLADKQEKLDSKNSAKIQGINRLAIVPRLAPILEQPQQEDRKNRKLVAPLKRSELKSANLGQMSEESSG
jgi:hypothetical protein